MTSDVREQLAANTKRRKEIAAETTALELQERDLIAQAWRERIPPGEIAALAGRSGTHVRNLRPDDVPPAKLGGGAFVGKKKARRKPK